MATLLYFGVFDGRESRLDEEMGATPDDGTRVVEIVAEARRFGLTADARTGLALADLVRELSHGGVVIVALQAWPTSPVTDWRAHWEDGHYVVVLGLDSDRVYVMDPSIRTGYGYLTRDQFVERWHDYDLQDGRRSSTIAWASSSAAKRGYRATRPSRSRSNRSSYAPAIPA